MISKQVLSVTAIRNFNCYTDVGTHKLIHMYMYMYSVYLRLSLVEDYVNASNSLLLGTAGMASLQHSLLSFEIGLVYISN